jgi:hypothetical protein
MPDNNEASGDINNELPITQNELVKSQEHIPHASPKQRKKIASKFSVLLLIILIVLILVGGLIYILNLNKTSQQTSVSHQPVNHTPTPSVDPSLGWENYINSTYNFSFKYPANYVTDEKIIEPTDNYVRFMEENKHRLAMLVQPNPKKLSLHEFIKTSNISDNIIHQKDMKNENGEFVYLDQKIDETTSASNVLYIVKDHIISLQINSYPNETATVTDKNRQLLLKIFSTFKFLDDDQSVNKSILDEISKQFTDKIQWDEVIRGGVDDHETFGSDTNLKGFVKRGKATFMRFDDECIVFCADELLTNSGWKDGDHAGGPHGAWDEYTKKVGGVTYLIRVSSDLASFQKATDAPYRCPCLYEYELYLSDPY